MPSLTSNPKRLRVLILGGAALILMASVGYGLWRDRSVAPLPDAAQGGPAASAAEWRKQGAAEFDAGRYETAAQAYAKAAELAPGVAAIWSALGEARVMASARDPMPAEALADFKRALALDAKDPRARYFLAVARDLTGDHQGALDEWLALLADTPKGAVWQADLVRTIEQVGKINHIVVAERIARAQAKGVDVPAAMPAAIPATMSGSAEQRPAIAQAIPGPSASDLQAANGLTPSVQNQMAEGMVAKLEARLRDDPGNTSGWLMLIRSRVTLGQVDKAKAALAQAVAADPGHAAQLRAQAGLLGVH